MASRFKITVPANIFGGMKLQISTPDHKRFELILPPQVKPFDELIIDSATGQVFMEPKLEERYKNLHPGLDGVYGKMHPQNDLNYFNNTNTQSYSNQQDQSFGKPAQTLQITVPPGVLGGQTIKVKLPNGRLTEITLPYSATPGSTLRVDANTGQLISSNLSSSSFESSVSFEDVPVAEQLSLSSLVSNQFKSAEFLGPGSDWYNFQPKPIQLIPFGTRPGAVGLPSPAPTGRCRALLIGINYTGTRAQLKGCVNDAYTMQRFLLSHGFTNTPQSMVLLIDNVPDPRFRPTKTNILKGLQWLVDGAVPGDNLFLHFSGHGAQQSDTMGHERDGLNETILPEDFTNRQSGGMITDDEMWSIVVAPLSSGVKLTVLFDCCHCGTGLDLSFNYKDTRWFQEPNPNFAEADVIMFSGCDDDQTSADTYHKLANAPAGAMTSSFVSCYDPRLPIGVFLERIKADVRRRGFSQIPQLSASQRFDPQQRTLDLLVGQSVAMSNYNEQIGRVFTKKFKPAQPNFGSSPLGPMLLAAGFAVLVAPALLEAGAGLIDGGLNVGQDMFDGGGFDFGGMF